MVSRKNRNVFPGGNNPRNANPMILLRKINESQDQCRQLAERVQHLSVLLWLALSQGGDLIVDVSDMKNWTPDREVRGQKIEGTEKIAWTAHQKKDDTSAIGG